MRQLEESVSAEQIVAGWKADLDAFEKMRRKYFLYK